MTDSTSVAYAGLPRRIRALMIDGLVLALTLFLSIGLVVLMGLQPHPIAPFIGLGPAFMLEPLLVSYTGGSVGHHLTGLRIRPVTANTRVNLAAAFFRFVIKTCLGLLSLVFVLTTRKHQGIHDLLSRTIVVHKRPETVRGHDVLAERTVEETGFSYPSGIRRTLITIGYLILGYVALTVASLALLSHNCFMKDSCRSATDSIAILVLGVAWTVSVFMTCALGWKGKLYGARRRSVACNLHETT